MITDQDSSNPFLNNIFDLELFFQLSPDMICIAGYDGYFKKVNPAVQKTLGYTYDELFSKPINEFVYDEDKAITSYSRENLKKSIPLLNFENRYVTKSGEIVWLAWTSMPIESQRLVFAIAKNITHKKKLEEGRNLLLTNFLKINNELKQLAYTTAHDFRSPVNNLLSIFSLIDVSKIPDSEVIEYLDILKSSAGSLHDRLNNYLDILIQKNNIQLEQVSLSECFNTVLKSLRSLIIDSGTEIQADFSDLDLVKFNKAYLESIFLNLITNSIKYAKPNTFPVISVYSKRLNGANLLILQDEGLGFDMEKVKEKIFGFNQKFNGNIDSKGIGLYLVYNHITSLGGQIDIESRLNEGAKFTISFKE